MRCDHIDGFVRCQEPAVWISPVEWPHGRTRLVACDSHRTRLDRDVEEYSDDPDARFLWTALDLNREADPDE